MAYLFKARRKAKIQKAAGDIKARNEALRELRSFLDEKEPGLVYFLVNTWRAQGRAITYKMLREAILSGDISWDVLQEWQEDYAVFINRHMRPAYEEAIAAAARRIERKHPGWYFNPMADGVRQWTEQRAAAFATEVSNTQIEGLRAVIRRAAVLEDITVDQLARAIRPMVGLTDPQAVANLRYYEKLIAKGASEQKALDLSTRYAARQHRYRGYNIARTELAFAYNQGSYEGTKQAQAAGYIGDVVKVWSTADDERVCRICGELEGTTVGIDEEFNFSTRLATADNPTIRLVPPAHPSCRCAVLYKEITPPVNNTLGTAI